MDHFQLLYSKCMNLLKHFLKTESKLELKCPPPLDIYSNNDDKAFKGEVTFISNGLGLINDSLKFGTAEFVSLVVGSKVTGLAHKEYAHWKVILLEMDQESTTKQKNVKKKTGIEDWDSEKVETKSVSNSLKENDQEILTNTNDILSHRVIVADIYGDILESNTGEIFNIINCKVDYQPKLGDILVLWYLLEAGDGIKMVKKIEYVRSKTFLSQVTSPKSDGYIFDYKIFCPTSIYETTDVTNGKKYFVEAVESLCNYECNWRAVSISPDNGSSYSKPFEFLPMKVGKELTLNLELPQLQEMKKRENLKKVQMEVLKDIKLDHLYNAVVFPLTLKFNLQSPISLLGISIQTLNNCQQISLENSSTDEEFPLTFNGVCDKSFMLNCTAKIIGASVEKIIVCFDEMSAVTDINIMVGSTDTDTNAQHLTAIKGAKPFIPKRFLPKRLPAAEIPEDLKNAVELNDISGYLSVLQTQLDVNNFLKKQKLLLFLEEIHKRTLYKSYTLYKAYFNVDFEYLTLTLSWLDELNNSLIVGDKIHVFPLDNSSNYSGSLYYEGYIHIVEGQKISIKFEKHEISCIKDVCCRVEFIASRSAFRKCHLGLSLVVENFGTNNIFPISFPPLCPPQSSYLEKNFAIVRNPLDNIPDEYLPYLEWVNSDLNAEQKTTIRCILAGSARPLPYIIFGPPGTGKTVTVVEAIAQIFLLVPHSRILVATPSNSASDLITVRLSETGIFDRLQLARLNGFNRNKNTIPPSIEHYCWDVSQTQYIVDCRVIVCTTITAAVLYEERIASDHFSHVFLDEAGQMTEAESSIAIGYLNKSEGQVILAGDPMQLGPVVMSPIAKVYGYGISMLARLYNSLLYSPDYTMALAQKNLSNDNNCAIRKVSLFDSRLITQLVRNYRSNAALIHIPSLLFYHNAIVAPEIREEDALYRQWPVLPNKNFPLLFYGFRGICSDDGTGSKENVMEATIVAEFVQSLLAHGIHHKDIGVITPYRLQVKTILQNVGRKVQKSIDVGSVEKFQGQERGVIIISTVRSYSPNATGNSAYNIGFVASAERFNVAITRARSLLIVIGDPTVLEFNNNWRALISYCNDNGAFIDTRGQSNT